MKALDRYLISWTRLYALALVVHIAAYFASWAVNGGFSGPTWAAVGAGLVFVHETATRSAAYPGRYISFFRRSKIEKLTVEAMIPAVAFAVAFAVLVSLFV